MTTCAVFAKFDELLTDALMLNCEIWCQCVFASLILNVTFCYVLKQKIEAKKEKGWKQNN